MQDSIFLVFEYCSCDLGTLIDRMYAERQSFSDAEIKCLFLQCLNGVAYMHNNNVMHWDLKLNNLLITKEGILKLADFGLAWDFSENQTFYT